VDRICLFKLLLHANEAMKMILYADAAVEDFFDFFDYMSLSASPLIATFVTFVGLAMSSEFDR
jgi:hypothetical protein